MNDAVSAPLLAAGWLLGMLLMMEVGYRAGRRRMRSDPERGMTGLGAIEGAVFALFGLLIAFTFSGAASRFDSRRQLIAEEANAIGTAYLRLDLLPESSQPALRVSFRDYVDSRVAVFRKLPDLEAAGAELARSQELQSGIWTLSVAATRDPGAHVDAAKLLLPALNEMIDITTTRTMATRIHPPPTIFYLLFILGLGCSLLAGYGMAEATSRSWLHILGFTLVMAVSLYVILDIEYPRAGLIRLDPYDQVLVELRDTMR